MRIRPHLLLVFILIAGSACGPFEEQDPLSEMELRRESGTVELIRGGERIAVDELIKLEIGDVIETHGDSAARLRLEGQRLGQMLENSRAEVLGTASLENQAGHLLARATQHMEIVFDEVSVSGEGALFRVDRGVATTRTAVYRGAVTMSNPGEPRLGVRRLFEATTTANDLPSDPRPYRLVLDDEWDLVFLRDIVGLEEELSRLAAGLKAQLGDRRPRLGYFRSLRGAGDVSVIKPYLAQPTEDLLVAFTLADNADLPFTTAFRRAFALYREGGTWGVAAGIMRVRPKLLLADLEQIIVATGIADSEGGGIAVFAAGDTAVGAAEGQPGSRPGPPGSPQGTGTGEEPDENRPSPGTTCPPDDIECRVDPVATPIPVPTPTQPGAQEPGDDGQAEPARKKKRSNDPEPDPEPSPGIKEDDGLLDVIGGIVDLSR